MEEKEIGSLGWEQRRVRVNMEREIKDSLQETNETSRVFGGTGAWQGDGSDNDDDVRGSRAERIFRYSYRPKLVVYCRSRLTYTTVGSDRCTPWAPIPTFCSERDCP